MITNTGKTIIAKYMLGQAPAYASYMAVGCGPKPLDSEDTPLTYANKEVLDFEMFRVPISSRGYIVENDIAKIVLTAELPTEERYEISEVGLYSAGSNPYAGSYDSKTVLTFSQTEGWLNNDGTEIVRVVSPLDDPNVDNVIAVNSLVFTTNADNRLFYNPDRVNRYERCRYFNNIIAMRGDSCNISKDVDDLVVEPTPSYIKITGLPVDFSKNAPTDLFKLAFSVINKDGYNLLDNPIVANPDSVRVIVEFTGSDTSKFARFECEVEDGILEGQQDFTTNRYCVVTKQLQELKTNNFTWDSVSLINIYACVIKDGLPSDEFYVALDAMRLENITSVNPLYGLTGYSIIQNDTASTVIKSPNTNNYIEFRFSIGVG